MLEVKDFLPFIHSKILDLFEKEEKKKKNLWKKFKNKYLFENTNIWNRKKEIKLPFVCRHDYLLFFW